MARRVPASADSTAQDDLALSLEAYECSALERALRENGGDAKSAARSLGIGRSTFYRKLAKHDSLRRGGRVRSIG
jgi:two-component system C4-dicarboxylate transport response regulator DctD